MSVYVDGLRPCLRRKKWKHDHSCHLFADDEKELMEFAKKIGLKESWVQRKKLLHFDLTAAKRETAVAFGAMEVDGRFLVEKIAGNKCKNC